MAAPLAPPEPPAPLAPHCASAKGSQVPTCWVQKPEEPVSNEPVLLIGGYLKTREYGTGIN